MASAEACPPPARPEDVQVFLPQARYPWRVLLERITQGEGPFLSVCRGDHVVIKGAIEQVLTRRRLWRCLSHVRVARRCRRVGVQVRCYWIGRRSCKKKSSPAVHACMHALYIAPLFPCPDLRHRCCQCPATSRSAATHSPRLWRRS